MLIAFFRKPSLLLLLAGLPFSLSAAGAKPKISADIALELLMAGNSRLVLGRLTHPDQTTTRRKELAQRQQPFAIVLTCADSRVAPEIYFDQGLGRVFKMSFDCHSERSEESTWSYAAFSAVRMSCWILRSAQNDRENGPF